MPKRSADQHARAPRRIFVSYSRHDRNVIAPVVAVMRSSHALVFVDVDDIQPGKRWRQQTEHALSDAQLVVVFWCDHARRSLEVTREYLAALDLGKDVLPIRIDDTPVPAQLAEFQTIDFRESLAAHHASIEPSPRLAGGRRAPWIAGAGVMVSVAVIVAAWNIRKPLEVAPMSADRPVGPPPPMDVGVRSGAMPLWVLAIIALAIVLAVTVAIWRRRARRRSVAVGTPAPCEAPRMQQDRAGTSEHRPLPDVLASRIEAEILRRS